MGFAHRFFYTRRSLDLGPGDDGVGLVSSPNVPRTIAAAVSAKVTTLHELQTVYGLEDLYDLLEVAIVDAHNQSLMMKEPS